MNVNYGAAQFQNNSSRVRPCVSVRVLEFGIISGKCTGKVDNRKTNTLVHFRYRYWYRYRKAACFGSPKILPKIQVRKGPKNCHVLFEWPLMTRLFYVLVFFQNSVLPLNKKYVKLEMMFYGSVFGGCFAEPY